MTINQNLAVATVVNELIGQLCEDMRVKCNIPREVFNEYMDESITTHPQLMIPVVEEIGKILLDMDEEEIRGYYLGYLDNLLSGMFL